jgi:cobalt-zinc-cadmium efflux system membrane fusion protein
MNRALLLLSFFIIGFSACHNASEDHKESTFIVKGDTIIVSEASNLNNKLKTTVVKSESYSLQMQTAGIVKAIPTNYAEIAPPFPGRVLNSHIRLGMKVTPETPLFEITAPDFIEAQKLYFQAKSQYHLSEQRLKRQQDLIKNGVGTQKDLEEAETGFEIARKEFENASVAIKIFKANPDQLILGQPLVVRSPIHGEIVENKIIVGQFIQDNAAPVATVAELSKVWVTGMVKEKDLSKVSENDRVEVELIAYPGEKIKGIVYHISQKVDENTRALEVFVECDNPNDNFKHRKLKPGMYATVNFIDAPATAILIPANAVMQMADQSFVFTELAPGKYRKCKVEISSTENNRVIIKSGLKDGDKIVTEGSFYLLDAK